MSTTTLDLDRPGLAVGKHTTPEDGCCLVEARTIYHGWRFSDSPEEDSPVIDAFLRSWNDALPDADRDAQLARYIPGLIPRGTPEQEATRAWMATDWLGS